MTDSEKLISLKKAYAEIILNTAKEAAARVMMAEKKAVRYQREIADVKENALQMMLRLKQMMDLKIHEADVAASRQQSKIDELEAQLHEAEDIVKDLREELAIVRDELYYMRKNRPHQMSEQPANQVVTRGQEAQGEEVAPSVSGFDHNQVLKVQAINVAESEMGNLFDQRTNPSIPDGQCETRKVSNLDMAPDVSPTNELGSLNRSSQKVHELTIENFSNGAGLHGKSHFAKDDSTVRADCENSGKSVTQTSSPEVHVSERKSHNRTKQDRKSKKAFYLSGNTKAYKHTFKKSKTSSSLRKSQSLAKKVLKSLQKTYRATSKAYPCPIASSAVKETDSLKNSGLPFKAVELCSEIGLHKPIQRCSQSTPENDKSIILNVSTGEENGSADSSVTCAADPEIACIPSCAISEEPDESDADGAFQPKTDRSIKFTFQRKRKKECIGSVDKNDNVELKKSSHGETLVGPSNVVSNGNDLFNESSHTSESNENTLKELKRSLKRMNVDKQNIKTSMKRVDEELQTPTEPKVIGIVPKATRNSHRLAQVARQLLSMSEKK